MKELIELSGMFYLDTESRTSQIRVHPHFNVEFLGAPVGCSAFQREWLTNTKLPMLVTRLSAIARYATSLEPDKE